MIFQKTSDLSSNSLVNTLAQWSDIGWLRSLDWAFAAFLWHEAPEVSPWVIMAAALASHQLGRGHVYLDLEATLNNPTQVLSLPPEQAYRVQAEGHIPPPLPSDVLRGLTLETWRAALQHPPLVDLQDANTVDSSPLVLRGNRLYLRRYWQYQQSVNRDIEQRVSASDILFTPEAIRSQLDRLFPEPTSESSLSQAPVNSDPDWQKMACALAARSRFSVITGGPGTGKTTTVVKLLALLQGLTPGLEIRLTAPTGKAAARLSQSISRAITRDSRLGHDIPHRVTTLHRLLGNRAESRHFRHNARNPLPIDVLVIDEVSMVDLEMMAATLAALPAQARLILLGDKDQLASVEAGAVLGELCHRAQDGHYTQAISHWLRQASGFDVPENLQDGDGTPQDQAITMLRYSHRFPLTSGIGRLARAVNEGDNGQALALLRNPPEDLAWLVTTANAPAPFEELVVNGNPLSLSSHSERVGYRHYLRVLQETRPNSTDSAPDWDSWAKRVLDAHDQFQVLCALRKGPWGVEGLNERIEQILARQHLIDKTGEWYEGRPVLVTRNDYSLGLMNGDIGMTLLSVDSSGSPRLQVAFIANDNPQAVQWVGPSRLRAVETVFALTVHKSQGSEFTHTALVLPDGPSPVVTQKLLYTGITRASRWFTLVSNGRTTDLWSGLATCGVR